MKSYTIATLGSHSALQILKGAKDEGFKTLVIHIPKVAALYRRFSFIDEFIEIPSYKEFPRIQNQLKRKKIIIIPHGSFVAYLGIEGNKQMTLPYFGNKKVLDWEENRLKQRDWLEKAGLALPKQYSLGDKIEFPVIVKSFGAAGGRGYFIAKDKVELKKKLKRFGNAPYVIQQYIIGVPFYIHYFYSPLLRRLEILSMDRRYESNTDGLGRIPWFNQPKDLEPSFVLIGNSPLMLRESMLVTAFAMGEDVVAASRQLIDGRGLFGPFCLETVITPDQKMHCIEISCRIVGGTNLFVDGSAYSSLHFNEPMSTGRRIAREIKEAIKKRRLEVLLD